MSLDSRTSHEYEQNIELSSSLPSQIHANNTKLALESQKNRLKWNWVLVSVAFSLNHGAVMVVLAYATSDFGASLGSWASSMLWLMYGFAALLFASGFVRRLGPKNSIFLCLVLYSIYVGSAVLAKLAPDSKWISFMLGSIIGGLAAGCLWTAQGNYVGASAAQFASAGGTSLEKANSIFSGIFGSIYVGLEVVIKGLSSIIRMASPQGELGAMITMTCVAFFSSFLMIFASKLDGRKDTVLQDNGTQSHDNEASQNNGSIKSKRLCEEAMVALSFLWRERRCKLLYPFSFSRTFTGSIESYYLNSVIVQHSIGADAIGYLSATHVLVAFAASVPVTLAQARYGPFPVMVFGATCRFLVALSVLACTSQQLIDAQWGIIVLYLLQGFSAIVGEITLRSVYLDFFPREFAPAFANLIIAQAVGAAFSLFLFPMISTVAMGAITMCMDILAVCCVAYAFNLNGSFSRQWNRVVPETTQDTE